MTTTTRPKVVAIDLDGTILKYNGDYTRFGQPLPGMIDVMHAVKAAGWIVVIWTCRQDTPELRAHLKKHEVPYDYINENPHEPPDTSRKLHADVYLDDKGLRVTGETKGLAEKIVNFKPWWQQLPFD